MPILVAQVFRREPAVQTERGPAQRNVRVPVNVPGSSEAPGAIRYGDFAGQGRAPGHNLPHGKQQIYTSSNAAEILSVMMDDFHVQKVIGTNVADMPAGRQAPLIERANIYRPETQAYGSAYTLFGEG